jgi:hypothetical protein
MRLCMATKVRKMNVRLRTIVTLILSVIVVSSYVGGQILFELEPLLACWTVKKFQICMGQRVFLQILYGRQLFVANFARILVLVLVGLLVRSNVGLGDQFLAILTRYFDRITLYATAFRVHFVDMFP